MPNKIIVNVTKEYYNILLLENNEITEFHKEKRNEDYIVGNVLVGEVKKLMPSFNAAFVDINHERNAFLHYSDLAPAATSVADFIKKARKIKKTPDLTKLTLAPLTDKNGKIGEVLKVRQKVIVQIAKEVIRSKGVRVTTALAIAGRYVILVPFSNEISTSKKIESANERERLEKLISFIKPNNFGVIVRTVAEGKNVSVLDKDLKDLRQKWEEGVKGLHKNKIGEKIISELCIIFSIIRDMFGKHFDKIIVDDRKTAEEIKKYISNILPTHEKVVYLYQGEEQLFDYLNLNKKLDSLLSTIVGLKGGGYIIIEQTEALTTIDVNTGNCIVEGASQEEFILYVNTQAAEEIARQMRLRNIGGIIVIDFVGMNNLQYRRDLYQLMKELMRKDSAKSDVLPLSKFCLMQITRARVRPVMTVENKEICPTCHGAGKIQSSMSVIVFLEEQLKLLLLKHKVRNITIHVHPYIYAYLNHGFISKKWKWVLSYWQWIRIVEDATLGITNYRILNRKKEVIATNPKLQHKESNAKQ